MPHSFSRLRRVGRACRAGVLCLLWAFAGGVQAADPATVLHLLDYIGVTMPARWKAAG
jgi:hypothetical protein